MERRRTLRSAKLEVLILASLLSPALALFAKDISDYPLRVEILMNHYDRYRPYPYRQPNYFMYRVNGQGNVMDGSTVHAFDFKYVNDHVVRFTAPNQTYPARWKKPQRELEVLAPDVGHEGKYMTCDMDTTVHAGVYVGRGGGITEISQDDYQARQAHPETTAASQGQEEPATTSNLSVTSNPASAEIEVDGELMGMTPSVLQLSVGEHTIALRKAGYKLWQRKMKVVAGEIKLNADLEPETSK
jgi:hypothetical protein